MRQENVIEAIRSQTLHMRAYTGSMRVYGKTEQDGSGERKREEKQELDRDAARDQSGEKSHAIEIYL